MNPFRHTRCLRALLAAALALAGAAWAAPEPVLRYAAPATDSVVGWEHEALPIGNGRLGGMLFGGVAAERLQFNDITLWTGDAREMGAYQPFGDVRVRLAGHEAAPSAYERRLHIDRGVHVVEYTLGGTRFRRETFASHPAQVIVMRLTASAPGRLSGRVALSDRHGAHLAAALQPPGARLFATGSLAGWVRPHDDGRPRTEAPSRNQLAYASQLQVQPRGGTLRLENGEAVFEGCDELTLTLAAGTSYVADAARAFMGEHPLPRVTAQLDAAVARGAAALQAEHEQDHGALFGRVALDLGPSAPERRALPTDERLRRHTQDGADRELEALFFQYGRYLLIGSSRGSLPANLQGLWNEHLAPPWNSDYHTNINLQMNYWPAEPANLSELHRPFFQFVQSLVPEWRRAVAETAARARAGTLPPEIVPWGETFTPPPVTFLRPDGATVRGWAVRTESNPYGALGYLWNLTANAWYALHFWEHYAFTQDRRFLREQAWPLMKEVCEFWIDRLVEVREGPHRGRLVVPQGWSPEHGPVEDGVAYDQQIVWSLFDNTVRAAAVLGVEPAFARRIAALRDRLAGPRTGRWGQLLEWLDEKTDHPVLDTPHDTHRHVSHLFAVFPGRQITPRRTPELARAAATSLAARGDGGTGWSMAWKIALWARLHDGDRAHRLFRGLLATPGARLAEDGRAGTDTNNAGGTYPNLLDAHPPFQIDGNFGATAAIAEMLLQSHDDELELLPALPRAWPTGAVRGLRARGGFELDIAWADRRLREATVRAVAGQGRVRLRAGGRVIDFSLAPGQARRFGASLLEAQP